jgi:ParB-like chromosome segregation protein Spo0J
MASSPRDSRKVELVQIAQIRRERQAWHVRLVIDDAEVEKLANLIRMTGDIDPITVIKGPDCYLLGLGERRLLAVERIGWDVIPAYVQDQADPLSLLQRQLADDKAGVPYRTLERSWALVKLHDLLEKRGIHKVQKEICSLKKLDKGTVSSGLKVGRAISEERVRQIASDHDLDWHAVAALPRKAVRQIANSPADVRDELLHAACGALKRGESAGGAVNASLPPVRLSRTEQAVSRRSRLILFLLGCYMRLMKAARRIVSPIQQSVSKQTSFVHHLSWTSLRARALASLTGNSMSAVGAHESETASAGGD